MEGNLFERLLKNSESEHIKILGNQPTGSPEFVMANTSLNYRLQKQLVKPTWILAIATIITLLLSLLVTSIQMAILQSQVNKMQLDIEQLKP